MNAFSAALLSIGLTLGADVQSAKQPVAKPVAPSIVQTARFRMKVQAAPKFPGRPRPKASEPATVRGLTVTVQPELKQFSSSGPLAFEVVLKNDSEATFLLYDSARLGGKGSLVTSNLQTGSQWTIKNATGPQRNRALKLEKGESVRYSVVVERVPVFYLPRPIPFPRPRPIPFPQPVPKRGSVEDAGESVQKADRRRPPQIIVWSTLPCGTGRCRARLMLEFQTDRLARYALPQWTGKIASNTVDFTVAGGTAIPPVPPFPGPIVGPVNQQQAIRLAHAAAERALDALYKPIPGIRPEHQGPWIANFVQTATAEGRLVGAWKIGWTHFPKGRGFSYNVTVNVATTGATSVREVFTGYSSR